MPLFKPPALALSIVGEEEEDGSDASEDSDSDAEVIEPMQPPRATGQPAKKSSGAPGIMARLANMSVGGSERYSDDSPPGGKRGRAAQRGMLERQGSFDVTPTMTFQMDGLKIKPEGMVGSGRGALMTTLSMEDLEKIKKLGQGTSGKVFLMRHRSTGELYAVKYLDAIADEDTRRMAVNELKIAHRHARKADHLVHFVDAFYTGDQLLIAMEFADGGDMKDVIERSRVGVPVQPLGAMTLQILHGLIYLHQELHQVHRDLKPENVMLTRRGIAKLADFGISKQLESTSSFAMTQVGTRSYMAPERTMGEQYEYTSDVWSVGIIAYEALTARHPFAGETTFVGLHNAIVTRPPPAVPEGTPDEVAEFIDLCLCKETGKGRIGRPAVRNLLAGPWMKKCSRMNHRQVVALYLKEQMSSVVE